MSKTFGEFSDLGIAALGRQGRHVEQAPDLFAAAEDTRSTSLFAGLAIKRSYANQSSDLVTIELTQLGQMSQQHSAGLRADARGTAQDGVFVTEVIVGLNVILDEIVELANLGLECFDHLGNAITDFCMMSHFGTVGFLGEHIDHLPTPADQFSQNLRLRLSGRSIGRFDHLAEKSEDIGINAVGLGVFPQTFCEVAYLAGIDHNGLESGLDQFSCDGTFVSAGCFQDNLGDLESLQGSEELSVTFGSVAVNTLELSWTGGDLERILGDVNSDIEWCGHGFIPSLQMRASLSAAQVAVRVNPIAAARTTLSDGLIDQGTIGLTPSVAGSVRSAPLCPGLRFARLADDNIVYGILYHV